MLNLKLPKLISKADWVVAPAQKTGENDKEITMLEKDTSSMQVIAHVRKKDREFQPLEDHLHAVAKLTGAFAEKICMKETGEIIGLLHDLGKASDEFQRYILSAEGFINPDAEEFIDPIKHKGKIDHTTAGAQIVCDQLCGKGLKEQIAAQIMALCIASHHSGLIDCLTPDGECNFEQRMQKADQKTRKSESMQNLPWISDSTEKLLSEKATEQIFQKLHTLKEETSESQDTLLFKAGLLIRFLLSCLLDADRIDTADFEFPENLQIRNYGNYRSWDVLIERLEKKLQKFENKNEVDVVRAQVSLACLNYASKEKGVYALTVPTGGGKTLASLRFALHHAKQHSMQRIFYIIPFTSIIDQNAEDIRKILEDKNARGQYLDRVVLEHHSNLTPEKESHRQNLLAENWDAPVIFTTQVQFLEALYGSGTQSARRMHQLANSVIIFDEVQTIPIKIIHMFNLAIRFLVHVCGSTVVLCTATQPPLNNLDNPYRELVIRPEQHIMSNEQELFEKLKRVEVFDRRKVGGWSIEEIEELAYQQLEENGSVLVVVNTKRSAKNLYKKLAENKKSDFHLYHLSTNMCAAHRLDILNKIKDELKMKEKVICISTQLIEAGVNIDFASVIRYLAGLDSIVQSAGRCNRDGLRTKPGRVWIINPNEENLDMLTSIRIGQEITQRVLGELEGSCDLLGLTSMETYFKYFYYAQKDKMKYKIGVNEIGRDDDLVNLLSSNTLSVQAYQRTHNNTEPKYFFRQAFQSATKAFHVIDSPTQGVIVPYGLEGEELIADLCRETEIEKQNKLLKRAQRYAVNLFQHEFEKLVERGAIHEAQPGTGVFYLDQQYYSEKYGWSEEVVNQMQNLIA